MIFIQQQQKYNVFAGVDILIIYALKNDRVYCIIFRNYPCPLILLDSHDLQSCQIGQGKYVAITSPAQSTLFTLGRQAVSGLTNCLESMWNTPS